MPLFREEIRGRLLWTHILNQCSCPQPHLTPLFRPHCFHFLHLPSCCLLVYCVSSIHFPEASLSCSCLLSPFFIPFFFVGIGFSLFLYHHLSGVWGGSRETLGHSNHCVYPAILRSLLRPRVFLKGGKMYLWSQQLGQSPQSTASRPASSLG